MPFSLYFLAIFYLAPSLQDLHKSSTDLSKIFQNFPSSIPFHLVPGQSVIPAHSPVFHRSSQIFTDLSCHSASIYPLSTRYSVSKIFTDLPQIFQRSFKNFPSSIPFHLDLDSRSFRPTLQISKLFVSPLFIYLHFVADPPQIFQNSPSSFPFHFLSGQSVIPAHSPDLCYLHLLYPAFRTVCHPTNFSKMEDPHQIPHQTPMTTPVENNLIRINTAFQDSCMPLLLTTNHSCMILCDFPSRILNPPPNISIFSLDDFPLFLNTAIAHPERCVYVLTQQTLTLRKLLSLPSPLPMPFWFLTRTSSTAPLELKIIEIFHSIPIGLQDRISQLYFICTFSATLKGKKGPWLKQFDLFHLLLDPCNLSSFIQIPSPPPFLQGIMYSEQKDLVTQASQELVRINIPHSVQNILQAKFPHDMECLCYQVPIASNAVFNSIITALSTFTYIKSFNFTAILSAIYSSPENASISFIFIAKIKSNLPSILELFEQCNITYLQTFTTLIFKASPTQLEEALLKALDLGISVPPSFLNSTKRIVFSNTEHYLQARILPFSDLGIVEFQIIRSDLCTTSDLYFTPSFPTFIKQRFHCVNQPQLCTVKNHCGEIREVLAITSSSQIFQHIPSDDLPFSFTHDDHSFSLSYLEPILHISPKPTVEYPYETQLEHFQRFTDPSGSLASRIPMLNPHKTKGGSLARDIIMSLSPGFLDHLEGDINFMQSSPPDPFYILISPFHDDWKTSVADLYPDSQIHFINIALQDLTLHLPKFIIIEIPPRTTFSIPHFYNKPLRLANQGWISVTPFSFLKIILPLPSIQHIPLLIKALTAQLPSTQEEIILGLANEVAVHSDSDPIVDPAEDAHMISDDEFPPPDPSTLPFSPFLLLCYRILAYFPWSTSIDHPRQKLLYCIAGGLHLADQLIIPFLTTAIQSFAEDYFTHCPNIITLFNKLSMGLPANIITTFFPQTIPQLGSQTLYLIPLPSFPFSDDANDLLKSFQNIFLYLSPGISIKVTSTLLFTSPTFAQLSLFAVLLCIACNCTITDEARARTSESKRPLVLRLCSILLEAPRSSTSSGPQHLVIEQFHPESQSVTVYDPKKGIFTLPTDNILSLEITALIFKRASSKYLICPQLLKDFCTLSLKNPIPTQSSPFSIISLFDGSGSFTDVIASTLKQWPHAILAAEMDADTRSVVSKVKGWPVEGSVWAFDKKGAHTFYATNVWSLVLDACLLLRQFISLLPPNSIIFIGAGSPCQDLTSIGRGKGTLGLAGDRSVHIHCVWAVLYFLSKTRFWERTVILLENAGSMLPHMKKYIHDLFGIPHACCHYLNCSTWGSVTRARYFFTSSDLTVLPDHSPSPFDPGWFPTVKPSKENPARFVPIPLPPWLRPRDYTSKGDVVQSPLAYHPKNLLYDISFFGSWELFCDACHANRSNLYPDIPFKQFLPEFLWKEWDSLIEWKADFDSQLTPEILTVSKLQEFYSNPHIYLPFRLPSLEEKAKDSELSSLITTTQQEANPPLRTLHNIIGNFFKPSAVLAALGGADRISNFVNGANTPNQWQPSSPSQVDTAFSTLKQTVSQSITSQPTLHSHLVEKWYPKNLPKLESLDFWHKAFHLQTPPVLTSPMTPLPTPPPTAPKQFISPLSPLALSQLQKFDALYQLTTKAIFHNYHLDVLLSAPFPPFKSLALPILLSTSDLTKFNFLKSYFQGWELTQSSVVILVLYEDANHVEFFSFGPISSYQQLYLLSFSSSSDTFQFSLLLQQITPPVTFQPLLTKLHAVWNFPPHLSTYINLLQQFPTLALFDNISNPRPPSIVYSPFGHTFVPTSLLQDPLLEWVATFFEGPQDTPMWCPERCPDFTGDFPFLRHVQFWLHLHNKYQEAYELPPHPFVLLSWYTPGTIPSAPDIRFCPLNHTPTPESIASTKCPLILAPNTFKDIHMDHYGIVVGRPSEFFSELDTKAIVPHPITYP